MKKTLLSILIMALIAVVVVSAGSVFAQTSTPGDSDLTTESGSTTDEIESRPYRRGGDFPHELDGLLHDQFMTAYAEKLGLSVEDLETRLTAGERLSEIAVSTGLTIEEYKTLSAEVRSSVIDQAVQDGTLTQEQADLFAGRGSNFLDNREKRGGGKMFGGEFEGLLHDEFVAAYAEKLNLSIEDLETRLEAGERMSEIAVSTGLSIEEYQALSAEVRSTVIDKALQDGTLTQKQADFLSMRGSGLMNGRGMRGNGRGLRGPCLEQNTQNEIIP